MDAEDLYTMLLQAWDAGVSLVHNWSNNHLGGQAWVVREWCEEHEIDWGSPMGYPVQESQRALVDAGRATRWRGPGPGRYGRVMFSLSEAESPQAHAAAARVAAEHGFAEEA